MIAIQGLGYVLAHTERTSHPFGCRLAHPHECIGHGLIGHEMVLTAQPVLDEPLFQEN
jgi:hypothetical protein